MIKITNLFFYITKYFIKKPSFWLLLLILPVITSVMTSLVQEEDQAITASVFIETTDSDSFVLDSYLTQLQDYTGNIQFVLCNSMDEMQNMVINKSAECGYFVPSSYYEDMISGNTTELITVYTSSASVLTPLVNEALYAILYSEISKHAVCEYLLNSSDIAIELRQDYSQAQIYELYEKYLHNNSTFHFEQIYHQNNIVNNNTSEANSMNLFPLRGLLAVYILFSAFVGILEYYHNSSNIIFANKSFRFITVFIPTTFSVLSAMLCLVISRNFGNVFYELFILFVYSLLCSFFVYLLSFIITKANMFYAMLPIYLLANLIFAPIFIDGSQFLPILRVISYLFLPTYYLRLY